MAPTGVAQAEVEVEPWLLPTGGGTEVGRETTTVVVAGVDAAVACEVGRWSHGGTPSDTSGEHSWTELP
jgi:hypothetical protein